MKKYLNLTIAFSAMAIVFASCNKGGDEAKMIPGNAIFVASINMQSVNKKISWKEVKQTAWFQKLYADSTTPEWRRKILDNPEASGIDLDKNITFFATKNGEQDMYLVAEGIIKNEKDFEQFNKNFDPAQNVTKSGDVSTLTLKDQSILAWKGNQFAYVMNSSFNPSQMMSNWNDTANLPSNPAPINNSALLSGYAVKLFTLHADSSLAKNDKFSDLLKSKGDMYFWQNTEESMKNNPALGMVSMLKMDAFFKNNFSAFTVNFENGKIEIDQKQYMSKELSDLMKKYKGSGINKDMIANIPSQNVLGIFTTSFKPGLLEAVIKMIGADGLANMFLQQAGFGLEDLSKANNGNMLMAVTDLQMKANTLKDIKDSAGNDLNMMIPDMKFSMVMGVKDRPSFEKILNAGKKMLSQMPNDTTVSMVLNDKYFVASNSATLANQYLAGNNKNKFDFIDKIDGQSMGAYVDLHKIFTQLSTQPTNNEERKALMDENLKFWNYVSMKAGDMDGDALKGEIKINMLDQNTNSLKLLNNYADGMFKIAEANKLRNPDKRNLDSLLTPPPVDTIPTK